MLERLLTLLEELSIIIFCYTCLFNILRRPEPFSHAFLWFASILSRAVTDTTDMVYHDVLKAEVKLIHHTRYRFTEACFFF